MIGRAALLNTYTGSTVGASTVGHSLHRMTAGRSGEWLAEFVVWTCVGVWCRLQLW